ncbi:MAG: hypothetical protein IJ498_07890 [Akkermansia sp.]|nr:hypothetical protein [Akkermansia sp.]
MMKHPRHLSIDEKRDWLAEIFRDTGGEYSQSDKFKAMIEDTKLALMLAEEEEKKKAETPAEAPGFNHRLLAHLPPPRQKDSIVLT